MVTTIHNQPYRRRGSTDSLDHEDSQLAVSIEGEYDPPILIPQNQVKEGESKKKS